MIRVSGSPVAVYIGDLNAAIMDAEGNPILVGQYVTAKATCLAGVVKDIIANYESNPGFTEGDAFLCNDPYVGIMHQNDVAIVMPVYHDKELIAWVGADIHQIDVGGPTPGQVQLGAKDIFGEAPLIPPIRLMKDGVLQKDVERNYLRKSRLPDLLALDLRAKVAACNTLKENLANLAEQLGNDGLQELFADMIADAETLLKAKISKIPDGCWAHRIYLEFEADVYTLRVNLTKKDDRFCIDFTGTSEQAPATINMTLPAVRAWLLGDIVETLCWDMPWVINGIERVYDVLAEPRTLVNPEYPAGVSKSTTSIGMLLSTAVRSCMYKMLAACEEYRSKAMAGWPGSKAQEELHGTNQYGAAFGADVLDGMAGGGGARTFADGLDTGGLAAAPKIAIADVEHYEIGYPILYLWRRELEDSGGAGQFRGGNGIDRAYIPHNTDGIPDMVMHSIGVRCPVTSGMDGGHPSATNQFMILREGLSRAELAGGKLPKSNTDLEGAWESFGALARSNLGAGDVYRSISNCGGGYGDPLTRDPQLVFEDLRLARVTKETAFNIYGVVLEESGQIDFSATEQRRSLLLSERSSCATAPVAASPNVTCQEVKYSWNGHLSVGLGEDGQDYLFIGTDLNCLCPVGVDYKSYLARQDVAFVEAGVHIDPTGKAEGEYLLTRYFDPFAWTQVETEIRAVADESLPQVVGLAS